MTKLCGYVGDRESALIGYLYEDAGPPDVSSDRMAVTERVMFEAHLASCAVCSQELNELRAVRRGLLSWSPPAAAPSMTSRTSSIGRRLGELPAWAQVAAAVLVLGVSAGVANLDVRYDDRGLTIRTGWSRPSDQIGSTGATAAVSVGDQEAPWRAEMTALEQRMRADLQTLRAASAAQSRSDAQAVKSLTADPDLMRKVTALLKESERRQQSELALRLAGVLRDVNEQRRADLIKIDSSQRALQDNLGVEVLKQRNALNYLINVSQKQ